MKRIQNKIPRTVIGIAIILFIVVILYHIVYGHFFPKKEGMNYQWHEYIDVIYYITYNDKETHQKKMIDNLINMGVPSQKIVPISSINKDWQKDYIQTVSHVNTLSQFMDSKHNNCIVLEDTFDFTLSPTEIDKQFREVFDNNVTYDVIMLKADEVDVINTKYKYLKKVNYARNASGYIVNRYYAPILYQNYRDGMKSIVDSYKIEKSEELQGPFRIDTYWKRIQPQSNWYVFSPNI